MGAVRRDRGMGMRPRWRADGRWEARFTDGAGRRRAIYVRIAGRAGERECQRQLDEKLREVGAGLNPSDMPLELYVRRFVERNPRRWSTRTVARYAELIRAHLAGVTKPVCRVMPEDLEDLYAARLRAGAAPKTVELLHTLLRGALAQAAERGHAIRNVAALVRPPRPRRRSETILTPAEVDRLLGAPGRLSALWCVAYATTLRQGELLALRWEDVHDDRLVLRTPEKGGQPRTIPLAARARRSLRAHRATQEMERRVARGAYEATGLVFVTLDGNALDPHRVREAFYRALAAAGLPRVRFHDLRHSAITHLIEQGVPIRVVQEMAGHRSVRTTLDVYAHVTPGMLDQAVAAMDRALGS